MKLNIVLPLSITVLAMAAACMLAGCRTAGKPTIAGDQLPASCTLQAMSPAERAVHLQRLELLRKASRLQAETGQGFVMAVDLHVMSARDLQLWMENEQKCCSFLRMTNHIMDGRTLARVTVVCPPEMRTEVMETFGVGNNGEAH